MNDITTNPRWRMAANSRLYPILLTMLKVVISPRKINPILMNLVHLTNCSAQKIRQFLQLNRQQENKPPYAGNASIEDTSNNKSRGNSKVYLAGRYWPLRHFNQIRTLATNIELKVIAESDPNKLCSDYLFNASYDRRERGSNSGPVTNYLVLSTLTMELPA